tara:strand:- start:70 stop:426 length:357 start_codon:yes stop_codon:yes gene_type:complete
MSINKNEFKEKLKKWVKCEQEIKRLNSMIREYKKIKEEINPDIINYMNKKNKKLLSINTNYQIKYTTNEVYQGVSKNFINDKISAFLNNNQAGEKITDFIYNSREKKERRNLSIIKKK